jgi:hypothetical protein
MSHEIWKSRASLINNHIPTALNTYSATLGLFQSTDMMRMMILGLILVFSMTNAFTFSSRRTTAANTATARHSSLEMMVRKSPKYAGQTPPVGYFDPLGLSAPLSETEFKRYREAELKHGRVAML